MSKSHDPHTTHTTSVEHTLEHTYPNTRRRVPDQPANTRNHSCMRTNARISPTQPNPAVTQSSVWFFFGGRGSAPHAPASAPSGSYPYHMLQACPHTYPMQYSSVAPCNTAVPVCRHASSRLTTLQGSSVRFAGRISQANVTSICLMQLRPTCCSGQSWMDALVSTSVMLTRR